MIVKVKVTILRKRLFCDEVKTFDNVKSVKAVKRYEDDSFVLSAFLTLEDGKIKKFPICQSVEVEE